MLNLEELRDALEFAPKDPGRVAKDLRGWILPDDGAKVCAHCTGRAVARGFHISRHAVPVWVGCPLPPFRCANCRRET